MQGMMPPITNIDGNLAKLSHEDGMSRLPLHIVSGLIEIPNSWDVAFLLLPQDASMIVNNNCGIVDCSFVLFPLENRRDYHYVVLLG